MAEINSVRTWIELDTKALANNYDQFRRLVSSETQLLAVVKSNAYGHGLLDYSKLLDALGVDWFGVDSFVEADKLRRHGIDKPILVLGYTMAANFAEAAAKNVSLAISSFESLDSLVELKTTEALKIHIKIDTGMHRQGFDLAEIDQVLAKLSQIKSVKVEGVFSHFAAAGSAEFSAEAKKQISQFDAAVAKFKAAGYDPMAHICASSGAIAYPEVHKDLVRIGIGLTGLWPSAELEAKFGAEITLKPVLSWKTIITEIKNIGCGEPLGYSFTETLKCDSKVAILPVGYWQGYRWALSKKGEVLIHGQRCRVLGRVCMDMVTVDITAVPEVKVGDEVVLIGKSGQEEITVAEMAERAGSYNYEIITQINPLILKKTV